MEGKEKLRNFVSDSHHTQLPEEGKERGRVGWRRRGGGEVGRRAQPAQLH